MTELHLFMQIFERQNHTLKLDFNEKDNTYTLWIWNINEQLTQILFDNKGKFLCIVDDF